MNRFKTAVGVFLIFACGMAAGAAATFYYFNLRVDRLTASGPPMSRLLIRPDIVRELDLTDAQRDKIMAVSARIEKDIQAFKQAHHPELVDIIDSGMAEISELLDADQRIRFARIHDKMKHRWEKGRCRSSGAPFRSPRLLSIDFLAYRLDLTAEQIEKTGPILDTLVKRYRQTVAEGQEGRRRRSDHPVRGEIRAIEQEAVKLILPLLNQEQRQTLQSMTSARERPDGFRVRDN